MDFEEYLKEVHAEDYSGTDDDMPDAFDEWLIELSADEFIKHGGNFAQAEVEKVKGESMKH